jgi:hypothetical protein
MAEEKMWLVIDDLYAISKLVKTGDLNQNKCFNTMKKNACETSFFEVVSLDVNTHLDKLALSLRRSCPSCKCSFVSWLGYTDLENIRLLKQLFHVRQSGSRSEWSSWGFEA